MESTCFRVLFIADTHLGFDLPFRPRIRRRRRGHDFFANFDLALQPALRKEVDLVVHGGDLFYRSRVPTALVQMAMAPLVQVAERGIPVYIVPGNHERSRIPLQLWSVHSNIFIFDQPKTFLYSSEKGSITLSGFPFTRHIRDAFTELVVQTGFAEYRADVGLLCIHQAVEGSQVGASNYTFRSGPEVVRGRDIPAGFCAVLSGHIHRSQVLKTDLARRELATRVIYPGSIERTSFAERNEDKHYVILEMVKSDQIGGTLTGLEFIKLPARPMIKLIVETGGMSREDLSELLEKRLDELDPDSIVRIYLRGDASSEDYRHISAASLRKLAPPSMNVSLMHDDRVSGTEGW
jgi:exonuclease SbcD